MNTALGFADLVRIFAAQEPRQDASVAAWLGFRAIRREGQDLGGRKKDEFAENIKPTPLPIPAHELPPTPFWRVLSAERRGPPPSRQPPSPITSTELARFDEPTKAPLPSPEAASLSQLSTVCRRLIARNAATARVDERKLMRRLARAEFVSALPRRTRLRWPEQIIVVVDRSRRLIPLWNDQVSVLRALARLLRKGAIRVFKVSDGLGESSMRALDQMLRASSGPQATVLALSDLGAFADAETRGTWRALSRVARARGARTVALTPSIARARSVHGASAWGFESWEAGPAARSSDGGAGVERLLRLTSVALRVEPELLREVRRLLPRLEVDLSSELGAWSDEWVCGDHVQGFQIREASIRDRLRREFAEEPEPLRRRVLELVRARHAVTTRDLWFEEMLTLLPFVDASTLDPDELNSARAYVGRFLGSVAPSHGDEKARTALRAYFRRLEQRIPTELWDDPDLGASLLDIWQVVHFEDDHAVPPREVDPARVAGLMVPSDPSEWTLHQVHDRLCFIPATMQELPRGASPLHANLLSKHANVSVSGLAAYQTLALKSATSVRTSPVSRIRLNTESSVVEVAPLHRPPWASAIGRDKCGLWLSFEVKGVVARLRWIPPGTFVMGSPASEQGRSDNETQHEMRLTRGFWLGETPVTQALWEAVTGANPSRFRTPDRPVERVSWNECREFHQQLNKLVPGLDVEFPTEAQWEYACRAGTTTATYAGEMEIEGANNARVLADIAWYGGNSGVSEDFPDAEDSSNWPDKQEPHRRAATHPVAEKGRNAFGLYDMLGNVYEWCGDWYAEYPTEVDADYHGPQSGRGVERVLRGGAWFSDARLVRAAYRYAYDPAYSYSGFGVRLARGPNGLAVAERGPVEAEPRTAERTSAARGRGTRPKQRGGRSQRGDIIPK